MTPPALTCPSCGHAIPPDVQFCPECGAIVTRDPVKRVDRLDQPFEVPPSLEPPVAGSAPPSSRTALVVGAATLLVAAALAFFFWPSPKPSSIPVPGEPAAQPTADAVAAAPTPQPPPRSSAPTPAAAKPSPAPEPARRAEEAARPPAVEPEARDAEAPRAGRGVDEGKAPPIESGAGPEQHASRERPRAELGEARWYRMRFRAPLFAEPSETAAVVTQLPEGTRIRVTRQVDGFLAVESTTGKAPGYVSRDDAIPESTAGAR